MAQLFFLKFYFVEKFENSTMLLIVTHLNKKLIFNRIKSLLCAVMLFCYLLIHIMSDKTDYTCLVELMMSENSKAENNIDSV